MKYTNIEKSFNQNRSVLGEVLPLSTPYTVLIDISDMCNLRCNYCFRYDESISAVDYRKNKLMDWETFVKVVKQLKEFPEQIKRISLSHNGEPLCNRLLPKMVRYIKESGLTGTTEIHTNALLLTPEYIKELCDANIDRIVVSIQGLDSERYEEVCGAKIKFSYLVDMLTLLFETKTNTQVHIKIVDVAVGEQKDKFYQIFAPIGDRVFVETVVPLWTGIDEKNCEQVNNKFGDDFGLQQCCPLIFYTMDILPDGTIYPCSHIAPPFKLGNVHTDTLKEAWESTQKKEFLMKMLKFGRFLTPECEKCYIPQNTVVSKEDSIDAYRDDILRRMVENEILEEMECLKE